jgi:hypothetical protein
VTNLRFRPGVKPFSSAIDTSIDICCKRATTEQYLDPTSCWLLTVKLPPHYQSGMLTSAGQSQFSARAFVARATLCLFFLQGLMAALGPGVGTASHDRHLSSDSSVVHEYCLQKSDGAGGTPPSGTHDHCDCCILCKHAGRNVALSFVVVLVSVLVAAEARLSDSAISAPTDDADRRRIGWGSSWSSRAPPSFP